MRDLVLSMLAWISVQTGWTIPNDYPVIITLNQQEINSIFHGRPISIDLGAYNAHGTVMPLSYPKCHWSKCPPEILNFTIFVLSEDSTIDSDQERLTLFHELVHYMQFHNKEHQKVACISALEFKAYELQAKWMQKEGIKTHYGMGPTYLANVAPLFYPPCK